MNNNKDIFESTKNTVQENIITEDKNSNFFLSDEQTIVFNHISKPEEHSRRLNDYDFNLLKEDAYKDISDDLFKLEYKISKTENEIKEIDNQIQSARDINDYNLVNELSKRKKTVQEDYEALIAIYNDKSLSAKITDNFSNLIGKNIKNKIKNFSSKMSGLTETIISKMPKNISRILELKKSLTKLENINKSVDELVNLNIPYGESLDKYSQLSKYIIKANSIQSEITKYIKET